MEKAQRDTVTTKSGFRRAGTPNFANVSMANRAGVINALPQPPTPEDHLVAIDQRQLLSEWRNEVLEAFNGDDDAQLLLLGIFDGQKGRELQETTGLDDTAFASKRKLVRRRLERLAQASEERRRKA
jgi:hypothetical protein